MSLVIKGGTIVAADRSYKADVLVEGETIKAIGEGLKGDTTLDAAGLFRHAGRHRSAHPSRHAVHGHQFGRQLRKRHQGRAFRRHDDGGRLLHSRPRPAADGGLRRLGQAARRRACADYSYHMCITYWSDKVREDMAKVVDRRRDDLQALHGLQGRADGQRRGDVRLVPALRRTRRDAAGPRRERRHRRRVAEALSDQGRHRAGRPRAVAAARSRGRGGQPRHHARRPGGRAALYRAHLLHPGARGDRAGARARACASTASR